MAAMLSNNLLNSRTMYSHKWQEMIKSLEWRQNWCDSVSNHQPHSCLLNRLFRRRSKETSKLRATGPCAGNSPVTGEFPAQRASNVENVSMWWRHQAQCVFSVFIGCSPFTMDTYEVYFNEASHFEFEFESVPSRRKRMQILNHEEDHLPVSVPQYVCYGNNWWRNCQQISRGWPVILQSSLSTIVYIFPLARYLYSAKVL